MIGEYSGPGALADAYRMAAAVTARLAETLAASHRARPPDSRRAWSAALQDSGERAIVWSLFVPGRL